MNAIVILKVVALIVLPIIIGFTLFYNSPIKLEYKTENNMTTINVPDFVELNERAGDGRRMVRTIFATPFDLKYYTINIKDISKYEGNIGDSGYILSLNGKELNFFKAGGEIKETILTNKPVILDTKVKIIQGEAPSWSEVKWTIDFEITARTTCWDMSAKIILFLVAWNGLFFLGKEIFNFIKK